MRVRLDEKQIKQIIKNVIKESISDDEQETLQKNEMGKFIQENYPYERYEKIFVTEVLKNRYHPAWIAQSDYEDDDYYDYDRTSDAGYLKFLAKKDWTPTGHPYGYPSLGGALQPYGPAVEYFLDYIEEDVYENDENISRLYMEFKKNPKRLLKRFENFIIEKAKYDEWSS